MNENAKKWVEALESGEYDQTFGTLENECGYCCLGVACKIYEHDTGAKLAKNNIGYYAGHDLSSGFKVVKDWLGLVDSCGVYGLGWLLSEANDSGRSFAEIAEIIKSEPKGLFVEGGL